MSATGLVASPSGDVWVLTNGAPLRFAVDTGMQTPEALWQATMQPIYVAVCARCHAPGRILPDLSTYAGWNANRMKIENSVVRQGDPPMPLDGSMTSKQRMAVARWLMMR
jgi:mono/diheme cytochrome c family protein